MIQHGILPGGVGYMKILGESDLLADIPGDHTPTLDLFRAAVQEFIDNNVKGIIIDVRDNQGGSDQMVADFMSSFYDEECLYEYQNWYNLDTGKMEIILPDDDGNIHPGMGLFIRPGTPQFEGPVIALVNGNCISSGEGVALGIKNLPQGRVVGFRGTWGSFGMCLDFMIHMPCGFKLLYPVGQSLDKNKRIQLDSRYGFGGVAPTDRVPMTLGNALLLGSGYDVELEHALKVLASCLRHK
jgi:carboxyl-terminal processing protease